MTDHRISTPALPGADAHGEAAADPFASVVICTRNRAASLGRTLNSLVAAAARAREPWELLVVDNGSTDGTADVVAGFEGRLPVRLVREPLAGLSNARNAGVHAARGRYMIWTDDDVVVDEDWLAAWLEGVRAHPEAAVFGGRALPRYEEPVQTWFSGNESELRSLLAIRDSPEWTDLAEGRLPFGLNYAVRAAEQRAHPYDPELGVAPGRRRGGEEEAVIRAILGDGHRGVWIWDAIVHHMIPADRQSERYIAQYYRANGYDHPLGDGLRVGRLRGVVRVARKWLRARAQYHIRHRRDRAARVPTLVVIARAEGSLRRYLGLRPS